MIGKKALAISFLASFLALNTNVDAVPLDPEALATQKEQAFNRFNLTFNDGLAIIGETLHSYGIKTGDLVLGLRKPEEEQTSPDFTGLLGRQRDSVVTLARCYPKLASLRDSLIKDYQESPTVIDLCETNFKLAAEAFKSCGEKYNSYLKMTIVPDHDPLLAVKDIKLYSNQSLLMLWSVFLNPLAGHNFQKRIERDCGAAYYKAICAFHEAVRAVNEPSVRVERDLVAETVRAYTNLAARPECGVNIGYTGLNFAYGFDELTISQSIVKLNSEIDSLKDHQDSAIQFKAIKKRAQLASLQAQLSTAEETREQQSSIFTDYSKVRSLLELNELFGKAVIARNRCAVAQHLKKLNEKASDEEEV